MTMRGEERGEGKGTLKRKAKPKNGEGERIEYGTEDVRWNVLCFGIFNIFTFFVGLFHFDLSFLFQSLSSLAFAHLSNFRSFFIFS